MWNLYEGPTPGYAEQVYFSKAAANSSGSGVAVLANADSTLAFAVRFQTDTLPWFVLWKNTQATADGYVTGLEPGSSFPNPRMTERAGSRVISLAPGASVTFRLCFEVAISKAAVRSLLDEVTTLQVATPRIVHDQPKPAWS